MDWVQEPSPIECVTDEEIDIWKRTKLTYKERSMNERNVEKTLRIQLNSRAEWANVADFQQGIESYQNKLNRAKPLTSVPNIDSLDKVINDLKKCGYKKDNCELNYKFLNNLQPEWKRYGTLMRKTKNLMDINIDALYNILKQNQGDVNDALGYKKKAVVVTSDPLALVAEITNSANKKQEFVKSDEKKEDKKADKKKRDMSKVKCYNCKKEGYFAKDCKKQKVYDYNYYKTKMLLAKKDSDEQVLLAEDQAWMESISNSDQEINANMVLMAQIKNVLSDSDESSSSAEETIAEVAYYTSESESESKFETSEYYELEGYVSNKDVEIEKCLERLNECENKIHKIGQTNQIIHMIMPSKDTLYNGRKGVGFENPSYFEKAKDLRPSLYDEKVIGIGYTLMFLIHSNEALEIEKFKRARENKIEFAYDYENLNASYVNEKINFSDDYFQEIINLYFKKIDSPFQQTSSLKAYVLNVILEKIIIDLEDEVVSLLEKEKANLKTIESLKSIGFESSENSISKSKNQSENDCHVVEKECDKVDNSKVIAPGLFKLSVSQSVSPISMSKTSCDSNNVENLDTFNSVRRPKQSSVIWKKKGLSNTSNVDLSYVSHSILNKDVKRYSRKDLLSCNNSYLGETSSAYFCNDAMNVSCNSRMCDLVDENNLFIFDDESVRIYPVSKMPFRKKPHDFMNVCSKINLNKSLPRTVHRWLPKMQPLSKPVAKWILRIVQICLWIIDSGCSKHMTGNRALLTNFVEKFLGTVCFGNNDFAVIAGYGDVVIGSMTIKKVYYVEEPHNKMVSWKGGIEP
uniref:Integrase, catalytic region, zinc finger, CCHC-type, peptidase aspartic, catalytic n=1 Tax=Tanacetum cinerariifolium TaxID=118510 RepID=A0A6L2KIF8_TANCI|nr:integrase, catalytic region, zinc finger, CCHC-type, peptidase aspartic, catalytic [Tanacetum cinerariifolium]